MDSVADKLPGLDEGNSFEGAVSRGLLVLIFDCIPIRRPTKNISGRQTRRECKTRKGHASYKMSLIIDTH